MWDNKNTTGNMLGGALGGAIPGAGAGFMMGGPLGALLGGLGGAGAGAIGGGLASFPGVQNALLGEEGKQQNLQRFPPEITKILQQLAQQGMQNMDFGGIENRARQQFQTQTIPSLAERFTSMGGQGGQRSSAFESSIGNAGANLESQLASLRSQFGMQQLGMGLQPQFEPGWMPRQPGMLEQGGQALLAQLGPILQLLMQAGA